MSNRAAFFKKERGKSGHHGTRGQRNLGVVLLLCPLPGHKSIRQRTVPQKINYPSREKVKRCGKSAPLVREARGRVNSPGCNFKILRVSLEHCLARSRRNTQVVESKERRGITRRQDKWLQGWFCKKSPLQNPAYDCLYVILSNVNFKIGARKSTCPT